MISLSRTSDIALIESVFLHPAIKDEVLEGDLALPIHEKVYWLAAHSDHALVGMVVFVPLYGVASNPHIAILPAHRGTGTEVMRQGVRWMFENTDYRKILAFPFKPIMMRLYEKCGFATEGFARGLVMAKGQLRDCRIVGLERPC